MIEYNFYITPMIGTGTFEDPYRCLLSDEMNIASGEGYVDIRYPQRLKTLAFVKAEPARHTYFQTLTGVDRLIPIVSATASQIRTNLDTKLVDLLTAQKINELKTTLESNGVNTEWADSTTTFRHLIRYLLRTHSVGQMLVTGGDLAKSFLTANLTNTVGSIPAGARNRIANWMTSKGLDTAWITGSTSVRQVLHYIQRNLTHNKLRVMDEVF